MNKDKNPGRIKYWDIAKGITILLVILGHAENINPYIRFIIFSYHMPFFFIANAYFIKNYNLIESIKKSSKSLLIPYAITCILFAVICVNQNNSNLPNYQVFTLRIADMFAGMSKISTKFNQFQSVWLVWFVICLFAARIIYIFLMKFLDTRNKLISLIVMAILSCTGMIIGKYYAYMPWSIDVALAALPFMWFGNMLNRLELIPKINKTIYIICLFNWIILGLSGFGIEMSMRKYPGCILCIIEAIAGSILCIGVSILIELKTKKIASFFTWCGKNVIVILIIHCFEMRFFNWNNYIFNNIPISLNWVTIFAVKLLLILLVTWAIIQIKNIIRYLNNQ